jgi:UDP-N-acetyl-D-mannosaminuronic acid dehydrogenase
VSDIVIIGGCGRVGLPLGLAFARAGRSVTAYDIDADKVRSTNDGVMPFRDQGADEVLAAALRAGSFICTTDPRSIRDAEVVVTVIGTPIDEHLNPRFDVMRRFIEAHASHFRPRQLLVMRSTLFPGTTERVHALLRQLGLDLDVAFCPERVAEGVALAEISTLPQIVAACDTRSHDRAAALFQLLTPDIITLAPKAAELTKLFNNAWRYIQFAVANQFYVIANDYGVDFYDIRRALTRKYPRAKDFPTAGFTAGPCLLKDTMQLSAFHNNNFLLGHAAMLVNEGLPNYLVGRVAARYDLSQMTVGILGMTFKANSDDPRDSLSFKLRRLLQACCRDVLCSDPYLEGEWLLPLDETVRCADLLFIGAPHAVYATLDAGGKPVYDVWDIVPERVRRP